MTSTCRPSLHPSLNQSSARQPCWPCAMQCSLSSSLSFHPDEPADKSLSPLVAQPELFFSSPFLLSALPPRLSSAEPALFTDSSSSSEASGLRHWQPHSASVSLSAFRSPSLPPSLRHVVQEETPASAAAAEPPPLQAGTSPAVVQASVASSRRRRRRRLDALPVEERKTVLRVSHREVDAARRAREAALFKALQRTTAGRHGGAGQQRADRRDKVLVLQHCLQEIEHLRSRTQRLEQSEREKDAHIALLRREVEQLVSLTQSLSEADPLYAAAFLQSNLCLCLIDVRTGTVLDISTQYCALTGWSQRDVLHTSVSPVECGMPASRMSPHHMRPPTAEEELDVRSEDWYVRRFIPQYPSARSSLMQLMAGQVGRVEGMGRVAKSDGCVYEITWTAWLGRADTVDDGRGGRLRQPEHIVMAAAIEDAVLAAADLTVTSSDNAAQT